MCVCGGGAGEYYLLISLLSQQEWICWNIVAQQLVVQE